VIIEVTKVNWDYDPAANVAASETLLIP